MRVPACVSEQPVRVEHGDDPKIDTWWRGLLKLPCDRNARLFVPVDAADHEFAPRTIRITNLVRNNRSPIDRLPQLTAARMPGRRAYGGKKNHDRSKPSRSSKLESPHGFDAPLRAEMPVRTRTWPAPMT
jgi:hypothetical protein